VSRITHPLPPLVQAPSPNQSSRRGFAPSGVVVHETEGSYAGAVSWLRNPKAQASAHLVLREDGLQAAQLVPWHMKAWHAENANTYTLGIELAGKTALPNRDEQLHRAARIVGWWCVTYRIPVHQGDSKGHGGIVRHLDLGWFGGGHHDPGGFDWPTFLRMVKAEVALGGFRKVYGVK